MEHIIGVSISDAAEVSIEGDMLTIAEGVWPDFCDVRVAVHDATVTLEPTDAFAYVDRSGGLVVSDSFLPYGRDVAGNEHEMLDLLAWKQGGEWHIKRLVNNA